MTSNDTSSLAQQQLRHRPRVSRAVHRVNDVTTRPVVAIGVGVAVVAAWIAIVASDLDSGFQTAFATVSGGITLVMVFVLQHTQHRHQIALQLKLDELVRALPQADDRFVGVEASSDDELLAFEERALQHHLAVREDDDDRS